MKTFADLPGPAHRFLVGILPDVRKDMLGFYSEVAREHGGLVGMKLLNFNIALVSDPDLVETVLVDNKDKIEKSWDYQELRRMLGWGLVTNEGPDHRRKRKLIQPSFNHDKIATYAEVMVRQARERMEQWQDGDVVELGEQMSTITLQIIAETMLGVDASAESSLIAETLERFMTQFEAMLTSAIPTPLWVPTRRNRKAFAALKKLDGFVYNLIRERRQVADLEERDDLASRLLTARFDDGSALTDVELRDELMTMLMAGHETTALALTWALMLIAKHPEVEAKLLEEVERVLGDRPATLEDLSSLTYTRQVIDESMRLYPPVWGVGRQVKKGETLVLGDYALPPKTQIAICQWVTHRDPRHWESPDEFRPERWAQDQPRPPKYAYFPFIGGPRSCIGMHFALMEAVLVLAEVQRQFAFELTEPGEPALMPAVTLRPRYGLKAKLHRRIPTAGVAVAA